ncbi:MAG: T9SS type A sorting domain-containing protein [Bacteroidota bacterium]
MRSLKLLSLLSLALLMSVPFYGQHFSEAAKAENKLRMRQRIQMKKSPQGVIHNSLYDLQKSYKAAQATGTRIEDFKADNPFLLIQNDRVVLDVASANPTETLEELTSLGLTHGAIFGNMVSGLFPMESIDQLENVKGARMINPSWAKTRIGAVTSQGDASMKSDEARMKFGVNGAGTKVGVLSDAYNSQGGAIAGVLLGDLPGTQNPNGYTTPIQVLSDLGSFGGIDEGRAMLEIVHDVAPGAELAFASAFFGQANFAQSIIDLQDVGCDVIVDDIIYFAEPMFQDGIIAQAADFVNANGSSYFSSAGNNGGDSFESPFVSSGVADTFIFPVFVDDTTIVDDTLLAEYHDFGGGNIFQPVVMAPGQGIFPLFQWSDPFFSTTGTVGAQSDVDILLFDEDGFFVTGSFAGNIGGDPVEGFQFSNNGPDSAVFFIAIQVFEGPKPELMKYVDFNGSATIIGNAPTSTSYGHANAAGAVGVGASAYFNTPAFGAPRPFLNGFSSIGGVPILYDPAGNRIADDLREQPKLVGPDGANTTFFAGQSDIEGDGFNNFFGTSASAPHAAAVAALMLEADPTLSPDEILDIMQSTAIDMDNPYSPGFDAGFDFATGAGFLQADQALGILTGAPVVTSFTLIDADMDMPIDGYDPIPAGSTIDLSTLPTTNLSVRANTEPAMVGSVTFSLTGSLESSRTENVAPYALFGDSGGNYKPQNPDPAAGDVYRLSATPFTGKGGSGTEGVSREIAYRFVAPAMSVASNDFSRAAQSRTLGVYPNPVSETLYLNLSNVEAEEAMVTVFNHMGQIMMTERVSTSAQNGLDFSNLKIGLYMVEIVAGDYREIKSVVHE